MGLLNVRNLRRAKDLLEQNRHRVGDVVSKAGDTLDKASGGKTASVTAKASDAARKYSDGAAPRYGTEVPVDDVTQRDLRVDEVDPQVRGAQNPSASVDTAATAVKGAADALTNLINKVAERAEAQNAKSPDPGTDH